MENIRETIGNNLADLRKQAKLTQLELAEKLNYSDKSISKWEKGETLPDVIVLNELCEFYGVTLDYLTHEPTAENKAKYGAIQTRDRSNKIAITALTSTVVWMIATIVYVYLLLKSQKSLWTIFVWAIPATTIVLTFMNRKFFKNKLFYFVNYTIFLWSTLIALFLQLLNFTVWPIFLLGIPAQVCLCLWLKIKK